MRQGKRRAVARDAGRGTKAGKGRARVGEVVARANFADIRAHGAQRNNSSSAEPVSQSVQNCAPGSGHAVN